MKKIFFAMRIFLQNPATVACLFLASLRFSIWVFNGPTAFEGPGLDMIDFFERQRDSHWLTHDYFANASAAFNLRYIFGYFTLYLAKWVGTDWYGAYFVMKTLSVAAFPICFFLVLKKSVELWMNRQMSGSEIIFACTLVSWSFLDPIIPDFLTIRRWWSVAWWPPYFDYVAPQSLALLLGLLSIIWLPIRRRYSMPNLVMLLLCILMNPPIGFCIFLVSVILIIPGFSYEKAAQRLWPILAVFALTGLVLVIWQQPKGSISVQDARDVYIRLGHPSHYFPRQFGSMSGYHWGWSYAINLFWLSIPIWALRKNCSGRKIKLGIGLAILFYIGILIMQHLAAEYGISKALVMLGPSRFFLFGYWIGAIGLIIVLGHFIKLPFQGAISNQSLQIFSIVTFVYLLFLGGKIHVDDPKQRLWLGHKELYRWIEANTPENAVFLVPFGELPQTLPFVVSRAVFAGTGFPFVENYFLEYAKRESFAFGNPDERESAGGSWVGEKMSRVSRSRTPENVDNLPSDLKVQYVIRESKYLGEFSKIQPSYQDMDFTLYDMNSVHAHLSKGQLSK